MKSVYEALQDSNYKLPFENTEDNFRRLLNKPENQKYQFKLFFTDNAFLPLVYINMDVPVVLDMTFLMLNPDSSSFSEIKKLEKLKDIQVLLEQNDFKEVHERVDKLLTYTPTSYKEAVFEWAYEASENYSKEMLSVMRDLALITRKELEYPTKEFDSLIENLLKYSTPMKGSEYEFDYKSISQYLTIYRGETPKSTKNGMSWTTDRKVAEMFANRFQKGNPLVRTMKVSRDDTLAVYASDDNESEVLIDVE